MDTVRLDPKIITVCTAFLSACTGGAILDPSAAHRPPPDPLESSAPRTRPRRATGPAPVYRFKRHSTRTLPAGLTCLLRLKADGIPHQHRDRVKGVDTPVIITGPVAGIRFRSLGRTRLLCDCRLALALSRAAPVLRNLGVQELHFSSAYRYSHMPSGKLSRHAMGLALDVHRVVVNGQRLSLKQDFQLGLGDGCAGSNPVLNRMACLLKKWGLFDRVLTPDFDAAHYNHFHLAILSLHRRRFVPRDQPGEASKE